MTAEQERVTAESIGNVRAFLEAWTLGKKGSLIAWCRDDRVRAMNAAGVLTALPRPLHRAELQDVLDELSRLKREATDV